MVNTTSSNIKASLKCIFTTNGDNHLVALDKEICEKLGISEANNDMVSEQIVNGNEILLRIVRRTQN